MKRALLGTVLLSLTVLAGCISGDGDGTTDDGTLGPCQSALDHPDVTILETTDDPLEGMAPENAFIFETTNVRTCSLPAIGHHPLRFADNGTGNPHYYLGEIDMRGDLNLGAVAVLGNQETPTVYLLDITQRSAPKVLSTIEQFATYIVDVKISDDGDLLFTASQNVPTAGELSTLTPLDSPTGFTIYDISDPAAPVEVGEFSDPQLGCHMMSHEIIDGVDTLSCISQNVRIHRLERLASGAVQSIGYVDYFPNAGEGGTPLPSAPPNVVGDPSGTGVPGQVRGQFSSGPHDITVQKDELTGQAIMVVSHWDSGLRVVDLSDAPEATELGTWNGEGATHYAGNVHTGMMFYVGEQRYILTSPEYTGPGTVPSLWLLDATDYSDLKLVGEWFHPGEHDSQGLFLTTHQWQVAPTGTDVNISDVKVYLTMNHGGLWVLSLEHILHGMNQDAILGYNLARTPLSEDIPVGNAILNTWDVNVVDGYIYGSDRATGLWVFQYQGDELGDPRITGFA